MNVLSFVSTAVLCYVADINECLTNPCDQICRNTVGGYACECNAGFLLNTTTRSTCYGKPKMSKAQNKVLCTVNMVLYSPFFGA